MFSMSVVTVYVRIGARGRGAVALVVFRASFGESMLRFKNVPADTSRCVVYFLRLFFGCFVSCALCDFFLCILFLVYIFVFFCFLVMIFGVRFFLFDLILNDAGR